MDLVSELVQFGVCDCLIRPTVTPRVWSFKVRSNETTEPSNGCLNLKLGFWVEPTQLN